MRVFQMGVGLRKLALNRRLIPFVDTVGVVNLEATSAQDIGMGPDFYGRALNIRVDM